MTAAPSGPARLAPSPRVAWQMLDGEAVLIDLARGAAIGLNSSGSFLWSRLATLDADELASELCRAFDVDAQRARADVAAFMALLTERGFAEPR